MNNKGQITYVNLFPVIIIILLIVGGGYLLTKDDLQLPWKNNGSVRVRKVQNFPTNLPTTNENFQKQRLVIKSEAQLQELLNSINEQAYQQLTETINFDKEYVIAVTSDTKFSGGTELKIRKIYDEKEDNKYLVSIRERVPGDTCITTQELNVAIDLVTIRKTDREIEFERVKEIYKCNE